MTDNIVLEGLQKFIKENVSPRIKLRSQDQTSNETQFVHPEVYMGWLPGKFPENFKPLEQGASIPCMIVDMDRGIDGDNTAINIRIIFAVYDPGNKDETGKLIPPFEGYKDLLNLITLTREELGRAAVIEGVTTIQRPFRWGMYKEASYPYGYGWLTFPVSCAAINYIPDTAQQYL